MTYSYQVFGLSLQSDIACPELLPAEPATKPEVLIKIGEVPDALERPLARGARWQTAAGRFLNDLPEVARFLAQDGSRIVVQPAAGASEEAIRAYLLSGCLAILMHQRGLFMLHSSGVSTRNGAVLFAGKSGTGKSTMVSAFLDRGYKILADDMLALAFDGQGGVIVLPGFPQVKLRADSAQALGRETAGLRRVFQTQDKFVAPEIQRFSSSPSALHAIYDLRVAEGAETRLKLLGHTERFNILLDHTWQKAIVAGLGLRERHFRTAASIASQTYMARLTRPAVPLDISRAADLIEQDMAKDHFPAEGG